MLFLEISLLYNTMYMILILESLWGESFKFPQFCQLPWYRLPIDNLGPLPLLPFVFSCLFGRDSIADPLWLVQCCGSSMVGEVLQILFGRVSAGDPLWPGQCCGSSLAGAVLRILFGQCSVADLPWSRQCYGYSFSRCSVADHIWPGQCCGSSLVGSVLRILFGWCSVADPVGMNSSVTLRYIRIKIKHYDVLF